MCCLTFFQPLTGSCPVSRLSINAWSFSGDSSACCNCRNWEKDTLCFLLSPFCWSMKPSKVTTSSDPADGRSFIRGVTKKHLCFQRLTGKHSTRLINHVLQKQKGIWQAATWSYFYEVRVMTYMPRYAGYYYMQYLHF